MADRPKSIDDYLAKVKHADKRAALQRLRRIIQAAAPKAEEGILVLPVEQFDGGRS